MKLRPLWLPYSKTFAGSPLSTDIKVKFHSMAPKTPHHLTSSYLPRLSYTTLENPILQQAIHHSLDILGSLPLLLCILFPPYRWPSSTSIMQKPIIIQDPSNKPGWLPFMEQGTWGADIAGIWQRPEVLLNIILCTGQLQQRSIQPKMSIVPMMRNPGLDQMIALSWSACFHSLSSLIDYQWSFGGQYHMSHSVPITGA